MRASFLLALMVWLAAAWPPSTAALAELRVTGGIAGAEQRLVVFEDGLARVELSARGAAYETLCARLEEGKLGEIRRALEAAGFEYLQREYVPARPVYDGYAYSVAYRGATVRAVDPLEDAAPPGLRAVIRLLQGVLQSVRAGGRGCGEFLPGR